MEYDLEICYSICFSELVYYPDENDDLLLERPEFKKIRDFLEIEINVIEWINQCYEILGGDKKLQSINVYYSKDYESYILLENYFDPIDQLDIIQVGIKTPNINKKLLKPLARNFSDACRYILSYEEGSSSISKQYPIDAKNLHRRIEDPKIDLSKGKVVRKIYTGNSDLNEEFRSFYWRDST
jgi:hypothetical protein